MAPSAPSPSKVQDWFQRGAKDDDIGDLLYHVGNAENWYELYKAIEMLERIAGGESALRALLNGKIEGWKAARTTANYRRHARAPEPKKLVAFEEAKSKLRRATIIIMDDE